MLIPMIHNFKREEHRMILNAITQIVESGNLTPILTDQSFGLEQALEAYRLLESGKAMGKVVIDH